MKEPITLLWNGQSLGEVTQVASSDWPWLCGKFVPGELPFELRTVLDWFARQADSEYLDDPPFTEELLTGWSLLAANGEATQIAVPVVDFEFGTIEWR